MKILKENGFNSPSERALGSLLLVFIFLMSIIGVASFILLIMQPLVQVILAIFLIPVVIIYLLSGDGKDEKQRVPEDCVMCGNTLKKEHESKHWKGSHEWCDDCY